MDIPSFFRTYPPFDALDADALERVVGATQIEFFTAGAEILHRAGDPARFAYLVRTGAVELVDEGRVLDVLGPGELFGHPSLTAGAGPSFTVRAREDTLCYLIEEPVIEEVLGTRAGLTFLSTSLRRRMTRALEGLEAERADPWRVQVDRLIRRTAVSCEPTTTVREAAETMTANRISSLLVRADGGWGIVTDRDLRSRVLAEGRAPETPVADVMSHPIRTVPAGSLAPEVLRLMLESGIHHVPVVDRSGGVLGIVSDTDLLGLERRTPFALKSSIERAPGAEDAIAAARELPVAVCDLVDANADPIDVGHVVGVTIDALTRRLLELAVAEVGDPPVPWAWIALGSEARHEQALATDQDHAVAWEPDGASDEEADAYFARLAASVSDGLEAAGIPRCRARVSADNPGWRGSIATWRERLRSWMSDPQPLGGELASIAFDFRCVTGPLEVEDVFDEIVREAPHRGLFLQRMALSAVTGRPPTGFLGNLVVEAKGEHAGTLDVKGGGIILVTSIARLVALAAGVTERRTLDRLREAAAAGRITESERSELDEAFRLLWQVRLEHQCAQARRGESPDDHVDPGSLGPLTRQAVKEAFRAIDRAQRALALAYDVRR